MESLLSLAFDNLSCKDKNRIGKGLKQIQGLLQNICRVQSKSQLGVHNRRASVVPTSNTKDEAALSLKDLSSDPAFREFFRLQETFEYNVATHLLTTLNTLLSLKRPTADTYLSLTLTLLHGILLLHPPSRHLFTLPSSMDSLLDLLDVSNPPALHQATVLVLVAALLNNPPASRTFERVDGLLSIKDLLTSGEASQKTKVSVMEFLYFYLMPETGVSPPTTGKTGTAVRIKRSKPELDDESGGVMLPITEVTNSSVVEVKVGSGNGTNSSIIEGGRGYGADGEKIDKAIKSTREKQRLLGQYLGNVDGLVRDLEESELFG